MNALRYDDDMLHLYMDCLLIGWLRNTSKAQSDRSTALPRSVRLYLAINLASYHHR
jgi:hypothetical protein